MLQVRKNKIEQETQQRKKLGVKLGGNDIHQDSSILCLLMSSHFELLLDFIMFITALFIF